MSIVIAEYDPKWPEQFAAEERRVRRALGALALRIDHVGSTSVPGLAAKPVIDIQVTVAGPAEAAACREWLVALGYTYTTVPLPYFHQPSAWPHTHHLHVREQGSVEERRMISVRDWLREHEADRRAYEALKRRLADGSHAETPEGRFRYSEGKTDFIHELEERSRMGRGSRS
jgi:GrpB-like predicted nucleotidyltransferase (UPF0157 family)